MRNFSKTLISMAAVMAVGSAMAAGAMAADLTIGQDKLKTDGKISVSGTTTTDTKGNALTQYTILVVKGATGVTVEAKNDDYTKVDETTIKQIDQNDDGEAFSSVVLGTDLADGNYKVLVGNNDGTVDEGYFAVSSAPAVETKVYKVGDVNFDKKGAINGSDATCILRKAAGATDSSLIGYTGAVKTIYGSTSTIIIGDVNFDKKGATNGSDATCILRKAAGANDASLIGHIGESYTVIW